MEEPTYYLLQIVGGELPSMLASRPSSASSAQSQARLEPLAAKALFLQVRELARRVHADACIELDTNRYSVPWRLIGRPSLSSSPSAACACSTPAKAAHGS